jgi:hypothetical protein
MPAGGLDDVLDGNLAGGQDTDATFVGCAALARLSLASRVRRHLVDQASEIVDLRLADFIQHKQPIAMVRRERLHGIARGVPFWTQDSPGASAGSAPLPQTLAANCAAVVLLRLVCPQVVDAALDAGVPQDRAGERHDSENTSRGLPTASSATRCRHCSRVPRLRGAAAIADVYSGR